MNEYDYIGDWMQIIAQSKGTKLKTELTKQLLDDLKWHDKFEKVLQHLYDPQYVTGISKTLFEKDSEHGIGMLMGYENVEEFIDYLHNHNTGDNATVQFVREVYDSKTTTEGGKQLVYWLTTKDINIGISRGTIEKLVYIPKFEIMLGSRLDDKVVDFDREFILSQKLDGINMTVIKRENDIQMFTRQGKLISGLNELESEYKTLPDGVYCGEAIYSGEAKNRGELFRLSEAEINSKKEDKKIVHWLFDYVTLEEWDSNKFSSPFKKTIRRIAEILLESNPQHIKLVPIVYEGSGKEIAFKHLNDAKSNDWEGLMLRYSSSTYEKKRSKSLWKLKPMFTMDLRVIKLTQNRKHPDRLGAAVVLYKGNEVNVGSGWTKEQAEYYWIHQNELVGKIIEVQTMEITENKDGTQSLRFPVFVRIRDDKDDESYD